MNRLLKALLVATGAIATTGIALGQPVPPGTQPVPPTPTQPPPPGTQPPPPTDPAPPPTDPAPPVDPPPPTPAEPALPPIPEAPPPSVGPPLTLAKGKILIAGSTININLSSGAFGQPISLAPSVWYGVDDKLTLGLTHDFGTTPWTPRPRFRTVTSFDGIGNPLPETGGPGICLTGDDNGCSGFYDNVGIDGLYALPSLVDKLDLAAHAGLDIGSFDPFLLQLRVGALARYQVTDQISVVADPRLRFGLTERRSNNELFDLPIWAWYAVDEKISAYVHTGLSIEFAKPDDIYSIPLQIGGNYKLNEQLTVGADLALTRINDGLDGRALGLRAAYAL